MGISAGELRDTCRLIGLKALAKEFIADAKLGAIASQRQRIYPSER
jgi:hypothetical protein